jgi:hypothetical protein
MADLLADAALAASVDKDGYTYTAARLINLEVDRDASRVAVTYELTGELDVKGDGIPPRQYLIDVRSDVVLKRWVDSEDEKVADDTTLPAILIALESLIPVLEPHLPK